MLQASRCSISNLIYFKPQLFQEKSYFNNNNQMQQIIQIHSHRSFTFVRGPPIGLIYGLFSRTNSNRQSALQCHVHLDYEISSIFASLLWFASIVQYPNTV